MTSSLKKLPRVLVVDDNPESVDLLVYFLRPAGYEIRTAKDGFAAIEQVEKNPPDIILLDIMLPRMDGFQVCEKLKKNRRTMHIPVVMITALKELKDKIKALEAGADDFISKPFDSVELLARVKSLLRLKQYHDALLQRNRDLERQRQALLREDQLKKELTNLIVHDMKNPLFVIQGNLQMMHMQRETGNAIPDEKYAKRIERSSRGLLRMILNLLDISRLEQKTIKLEPAPVEIHRLLKESIDYFRDIPEHHDKVLELQFDETVPNALADKDILERVFDNLFSYIFTNTPEQLRIKVSTGLNKNSQIEIRIFHEGRVIPEQFREKIFTKYAQTELKKAGFKPARGLGLIFCKLAMLAHQGDIWIDPAGRNGTCFILNLPQYQHKSRTKSDNGSR